MTRLQAEAFLPHSPRAEWRHTCALTDLTDVARVGFRGGDTAAYLQQRGYCLPPQPNQAVRQDDGGWVARLSQTEYLLLGSLADKGARVAGAEAEWVQDAQRNYLLPRQDSHAWLQLSGALGSAVMAKLCAVDLRAEAFPAGAVAQTSVARINVIVVNVGSDERPTLQLLFDRASRVYMRAAMLDAMDEFDGGLIELGALVG
ncbi:MULTISPECIES: sarcosine oxidase [Pseudomonas]|jgi:sarcosine oxidase, subunit gamma|uniref:sarcosine oxidase n=1 Tax=Pseudomonas TaxID=286 RepID=UPI000C882F62|nr:MULTISPECIES: sarcosine oxidase [Pseudomonas]PNB57972.1 sarcosine oxidase [Pseudomonas sp. FW305-130]EKT4450721.1 sarcosine oxidase [Pseudomonas putida]MCE0964411.1 sarcosine oxidase [Pseudomonas sp. NMI4491_12]MDD2069118.1 sarcosine oxidase [Pseudomonas putida]PNB00160.1 sarcosine oxidase [Pseudomonas sp. GW460-5]